MTLGQLENAFYALSAESIECGEWAATWMKLTDKLGPLSAAEVAAFLKDRAMSTHNAVFEYAEESGVLILTDFSMGRSSWPNQKEDQTTALLDLIRARRKRYTVVTSAHTSNELAEVSRELHSAICAATNGLKALVKMDTVPNYTPSPILEPEEQHMPFDTHRSPSVPKGRRQATPNYPTPGQPQDYALAQYKTGNGT